MYTLSYQPHSTQEQVNEMQLKTRNTFKAFHERHVQHLVQRGNAGISTGGTTSLSERSTKVRVALIFRVQTDTHATHTAFGST
jgi:hypothetical protein